MKKKIKQENTADLLISIIGIVSYNKESQIIWNINHFAEMSFSKINDFEKNMKDDLAKSSQLFSMFSYSDDRNNFFLISNKNTQTLLSLKHKSFDYFMFFKNSGNNLPERIVNKLSFSDVIKGAYILKADNYLKKLFMPLFDE